MREVIAQIRTEIRGIWRFRWTAMLVAWIICALGWFFVYSMPDIYRASAQVFVDADSRLAEVMGQVGVAPGVGASVFVVRQAMLGRPQLEQVARATDLHLRASTDEEWEDLIAYLSEKISVDSGRTSQSRNLYTITFEDTDRRTAVAVVNELLNTFVNDVLELKEQGSQDVTGYLDDQLSYYSTLLGSAEKALADFKKEHVGLLPGENGGVFERLQVQMESVEQLRKQLAIEEDRRDELRRQLQSETPYLPQGTQLANGVTIAGSPTETSIQQLESRRAELLLTLTQRHPDVVAINEQLELLYAKREAEVTALTGTDGSEGAPNANNPVYQSVQISLNQIGVTIAGLRAQVQQIERQIAATNQQINTIPQIEADFAKLNRDYAQYRQLYSELLIRKERERMGEAGEEREVVKFNITNPPAAAPDPVAPKRTFFLTAVLVFGLGCGAAVALFRHISRPVFHDVNDLRIFAHRPVLGAISMTWIDKHRSEQLLGLTTFAAASAGLLVVYGGAIALQKTMAPALQHALSIVGS